MKRTTKAEIRKAAEKRRRFPGKFWNLVCFNPARYFGSVDEKSEFHKLTIGDWFHFEQTWYREFSLRIGTLEFSIYVPSNPDKPVKIRIVSGKIEIK